MPKMVGVRYTFPSGTVAEFTYDDGCSGSPEEWVAAHLRRPGVAVKERFESDQPINQIRWPDGTVENL